tara:strand:- start:725 stop:1048 length:324 start_codon:yes stop_codon:yes gene_type:complete
MNKFEDKEKNLNNLIKKLNDLNLSYSHSGTKNEKIIKERDQIASEKIDLEKKNMELKREHEYLSKKLKKLKKELNIKTEFEKKFNQDINELNQETQSLVEEIDKWQM